MHKLHNSIVNRNTPMRSTDDPDSHGKTDERLRSSLLWTRRRAATRDEGTPKAVENAITWC
jgi:hypothetical protein